MDTIKFERLTWTDIKAQVKKIDLDLFHIIEKISPCDKYPLYKASYAYGAMVLNRGVFQLPCSSGIEAHLNSPNIPSEIKKDLNYAGQRTPLGFVLNRSIELFIDTDSHLLPWNLIKKGGFFASFSLLEETPLSHPARIFSITAGARNVFMLPNIGDKFLHGNLKRSLNIRVPPPKTLQEQAHVFREIVHAYPSEPTWETDIIFLSEPWLVAIKNDPAWRDLYFHIIGREWMKSSYSRNKILYDFVISQIKESKNLKPNPYLADTAKHLLSIASGGAVGFKVSLDETAVPKNLIEEVYLNIYRLRNYAPTLIEPDYFSPTNSAAIYYSLQYPTTYEFSPKSRKLSSTVNDLIELKHILDVLLSELCKGRLSLENTIIDYVARNIDFNYYHSRPDQHGDLLSSEGLPTADPSLLSCAVSGENNVFASSGAFVRGCVKMTTRESK